MANKKAILFCMFVAFGGWLFGYDIGVISGCLIMPDFIERYVTKEQFHTARRYLRFCLPIDLVSWERMANTTSPAIASP
ncbi:hypothetical protein FRC02_006348 [Tulasnella sp. 418]|nr:hypothetical protein FRC02_006348 [Tulasnella sp. 418]